MAISLQSSSLATLRPLGAQHHPLCKPNFLYNQQIAKDSDGAPIYVTLGARLRKNRPFHLRSLLYIVDLTVGAALWTRYSTAEGYGSGTARESSACVSEHRPATACTNESTYIGLGSYKLRHFTGSRADHPSFFSGGRNSAISPQTPFTTIFSLTR